MVWATIATKKKKKKTFVCSQYIGRFFSLLLFVHSFVQFSVCIRTINADFSMTFDILLFPSRASKNKRVSVNIWRWADRKTEKVKNKKRWRKRYIGRLTFDHLLIFRCFLIFFFCAHISECKQTDKRPKRKMILTKINKTMETCSSKRVFGSYLLIVWCIFYLK